MELQRFASPCLRVVRHGLAVALAASVALAPVAASAQASKIVRPKFDPAVSVNQAVRLPMLVERITKSYTLLQQGALENRAKRQLQDAIREFERTLKVLQATPPTGQIQDNYNLLEQLWGEFRDLTNAPATPESTKKLAEQNEEVVWIATKGAQLMVEYTRSQRSNLIAIAGDARVLTQRIAKLYLFRAAGIRNNVIENDLKAANDQLRIDIEKLSKAKENTEQIKQELDLAETQLGFLKIAADDLNRNQTSKERLEYVTKACDNILDVMERVTRLYEGLKG
jgi:hypothetical protein